MEYHSWKNFLRIEDLDFQGGGTAAHLMLELWPSLQLEGWEIDEIVKIFSTFLCLCIYFLLFT